MPVIDTYTIFGAWPSGGADLSLDRLQKALGGREVAAAIAHSTDSVFETTAHALARMRSQVSGVQGLVPAAVIDPTLLVKPWEFAEQISKDGYACVRFFPEIHNWPLGSFSPFEKCLEALAPSGIPVSVATTEPGQITALAKIDRATTMPIILVHVGQDCISEVAEVMPRMEQWYLSTDGLAHVGLLEELVSAVGAERIIFGSTAPRGSIEGSLNYVKMSSLPDTAQQAVLFANAQRLFGDRLGTY